MRFLFLLLPFFMLIGCNDNSNPDGLPTVKMVLGGKSFTLEVAATDASRQKGLMKRDSMPPDHGMIFVFRTDQFQSFWMKNTRIPLDIVYITSDGIIDSIGHMKPYDLGGTPSDGKAKYAIELNAGTAAKLSLSAGQKLEIPPAARDAKE